MPAQNRVGRDNCRDLAQQPTAQTLPTLRQPASLRVGLPQPPASELTPQGPVFFDQIGDDVLLVVSQPGGQRGEKNSNGSDVNHGASLAHHPRFEPQKVPSRPTCRTLRPSESQRPEVSTSYQTAPNVSLPY